MARRANAVMTAANMRAMAMDRRSGFFMAVVWFGYSVQGLNDRL